MPRLSRPIGRAPRRAPAAALVAVVASAFAAPAPAQDFIAEFQGTAVGDHFGWAIAAAGDVNGDGVPDLIVGSPKDDTIGPDAGAARVISGADGSTIHEFFGDFFYDEFGYSVAGAGDVNGDGYADVIVGAPFDDDNGTNSGSAWVFSGMTGHSLHTVYGSSAGGRFGHAVDGIGDINADGVRDFIVSAAFDASNGTEAGSVTAFSGSTGGVLTMTHGPSGSRLGHSLAAIGDVSGDGVVDWLAGAPNQGLGKAYLGDGASGDLVQTFSPVASEFHFGRSVSESGDLNGDGVPDFAIGHSGGSGVVRFYSGSDYSLLFEHTPLFGSVQYGWDVDAAGDVNGDGTPDLVVGSRAMTALVVSGTGAVVLDKNGPTSFGTTVAGIGDIDGDGFADIAVGEYEWDNLRGRVTLYSGIGNGEPIKPFCIGDGVDQVCPCDNHATNDGGCANSSGNGAVLTHTGTHSIDRDDLSFVVSNAIPGQPCLLIQGGTKVSFPFRDGSLCMGNPTERMEVVFLDGSGSGQTTVSISTEGNVSPVQRTWYQAWYRDPGGVSPCGTHSNFTNGVEVLWRI